MGSVSLGLSIDFFNNQIRKETQTLVKKFLWISLILLITGIGAAFFLAKWVSPSEKQAKAFFPETVRNQVAILYAGIREFKAYAGTRNPEGVFQDLSEYFSIATKSILDNGGYVIRVAGDTVVGIFQSSPLKGDHIHRAVRGSMAIQKALESQKEQGSENPLLGKVGIGISSGVVLYGDIDSYAGKKDNYIGESFKAASSLYALAGPGEIVISKDVYKSIEHWVAVDPLPPREMTQRTEAWESFRLRNIVEREPHA
jgi:class 3 adenylate cyclase